MAQYPGRKRYKKRKLEGREREFHTKRGFPEGSKSSEVSITVRNPNINKGKWTNLPSMYRGVIYSEEESVNKVIEAGGVDPDTGRKPKSYPSKRAAEAAARSRSNKLK